MSLFSTLRATAGGPWLVIARLIWPYVLGGLLLLGAVWWVYSKGYARAEAKGHLETVAVQVKLDAALSAKAQAISANGNLAKSEQALRMAIAECNAENARLADEGMLAMQEAEAGKRKAEKDLKTWRAKYIVTTSKPACVQALANLQRACPVGAY